LPVFIFIIMTSPIERSPLLEVAQITNAEAPDQIDNPVNEISKDNATSTPVTTPQGDQLPPTAPLDDMAKTVESLTDNVNASTRKRKRTAKVEAYATDGLDPPYHAATDEEKRNWKGFCEIESDPVSTITLVFAFMNIC
jgi:hypothetical protein